MENSNSIEQVIENDDLGESIATVCLGDAARKPMESGARSGRISDILKSTERVGTSNSVKQLMDGMARLHGGISDILKSTERVGISNSVKHLMDSMARPHGISDELRKSLEHTALLALNVDQSLSTMHIPTPTANWSYAHVEVPPLPELPPNPIWETNGHLAELAGTVTQLVDVSRHQAELSQAIRSTADLALKYAIQSGEDAKAATLLARKGVRLTSFAIIVAIVVALVSIALSYHLGTSSDIRQKEEIRLLNDISHKLQQLNGQPAGNPVVTPGPQTKPNK